MIRSIQSGAVIGGYPRLSASRCGLSQPRNPTPPKSDDPEKGENQLPELWTAKRKVVLNLCRMSLATACDIVAHMTEQEEFKPTAASMKAMQDLVLSGRASAALARDARRRDADLQAAADAGIVTITGATALPAVLDAVPPVVRQVEGVREVKKEVRLCPYI